MKESVKKQRSKSKRKPDEGLPYGWRNREDIGLQVSIMCVWKRKELYEVCKM